ncbi:MAG: DotH/IcmK family type IV secretion protein [Candidatus Competibacteraceae bacterium]|jgi:intracellular multiplication protein IcmK|nr:DotH/IcmK family type IV secretion protein [Candidatus Competibacteraceae bacterium]
MVTPNLCRPKKALVPRIVSFLLMLAALLLTSTALGNEPVAPVPPWELPENAGRQTLREDAREQAFETTEDQLMPMTPDQLQTLIESLETTEALSSMHTPPEMNQDSEPLDLNAAQPPILRVVQGYGTSIIFTDRTGRVWPLTGDQGFNEGLFSVTANSISGNPEDLPSVLVVQPLASQGTGNLVVTLKGLETPIVLTLALGQQVVDVRKEYKLPLPGPNAEPEYQAVSPRNIEPALLNVLNGLPPVASAIQVEVHGVEPEAMAWRVGDDLYLRTVAEVYSPEYSQRASNPNGLLHAYKLPHVPVLLVSFNGSMTEIITQE